MFSILLKLAIPCSVSTVLLICECYGHKKYTVMVNQFIIIIIII